LPIKVVGLGLGAFLRPNAIAMPAIVDHVKHEGLILLGIELLRTIWCYADFIDRKRTQNKLNEPYRVGRGQGGNFVEQGAGMNGARQWPCPRAFSRRLGRALPRGTGVWLRSIGGGATLSIINDTSDDDDRAPPSQDGAWA
jgi:hypothetical protein